MWIQVLAGLVFLAFVWMVFRFAMGLRYAKVAREEARGAREGRGARVVAEIPSKQGDVQFFVDDGDAFSWPGGRIPKAAIAGARLLLRGGLVGSFERPGVSLPPAGPVDDDESRERWDVVAYLHDGASVTVPCGTLREGVSRDVASRVFEALRGGQVTRR
jgi:hypothetical protein